MAKVLGETGRYVAEVDSNGQQLRELDMKRLESNKSRRARKYFLSQ